MGVTQKAPLASTFGDTITAPAWKKKPSWYQISSEDRMISPENEARMSARRCEKGHYPGGESRFAGVEAG